MNRHIETTQAGLRPWARWKTAWAATLPGLIVVAGCDLGVTNPGRITDEALDDERAVTPLVVGMGADLSAVVDDVSYFMGIASRDIWHSGAFEAERFMQEGTVEPRHVNGLWAGMHRARWVAEQGIDRMKRVLGGAFEDNPRSVEAYLWAGFSNRVLGENVCQAVIDGGTPQPATVHFERAEQHFTQAIQLAQRQANADLLAVAYGGRAQARVGLGQWADAAQDAAQVPTATVFQALFSDNSSREWNWVSHESWIRRYFSVWGTWAHEVEGDPRVPWANREGNGVDGLTPFVQQLKYPALFSDIDLMRGDEMRLIEAEAALRLNGDVDGALARINGLRDAAGVEPVSASNADEAWAALRMERAIVLWMEGRRMFDLRRFDDPFLQGRDGCIPISQNEQNTNPNLTSG